jgi:hypothetical protein
MNKLCFGKIKMKANVTHFQKKEPIKVLKLKLQRPSILIILDSKIGGHMPLLNIVKNIV